VLELRKVDLFYGSIQALRSLDLHVDAGECVALIGANGAGKSTTLKAISGLLKPASGEILFEGRPIHGRAAERLVADGICHVPEGRRIFPGLTVYENLEVATAARGRATFKASLERVHALFPRLAERDRQLGWSLSGGEQQMLAIGRALMAEPRLLLLDEPSLGLAPILASELFGVIATIKQAGTTILLVEQNAYLALKVADRAYVLENGASVVEGTAAELQDNPKVRAAYLGG
jgi:branched-chain amino acid transport system ATP-binding protein